MRPESLQAEVEDQRRELRLQAGAWLKVQRESSGLSQRELAEQVGSVYYTFVSQIESGRGRIPPERYEAWARALSIEPRSFAMKMLGFYEPVTYDLIFGRDASIANSAV
jgi:transcriptional regulator with XRE-family HTH domain